MFELPKPISPFFSSGPTLKPPVWRKDFLDHALLSRSHRSLQGLEKIQSLLDLTRDVLEIPSSHHVALVPGSATGAYECLLWNLLGPRPVTKLVWDVFSDRWSQVIDHQLPIKEKSTLGHRLATDLAYQDLDWSHDIIFCWNGSTSGLCFPEGAWIDDNRGGLSLCDATSAVFGVPLPWHKLDATAFSWQKGLGGESAHGMIVLSDHAMERLTHYTPPWPIPFLFSLKKNGQINHRLFEGFTLNTPSLMCLEDALLGLKWAKALGGGPSLYQKTQRNSQAFMEECMKYPLFSPLIPKENLRSKTTACVKILHPHNKTPVDGPFLKKIATFLESHHVAYDILNHSQGHCCLRLWCGPTQEAENLKRIVPWIHEACHYLS